MTAGIVSSLFSSSLAIGTESEHGLKPNLGADLAAAEIGSSWFGSSLAIGSGTESEYVLKLWKLNFGAFLAPTGTVSSLAFGTGSTTVWNPWSLNFGGGLVAVGIGSLQMSSDSSTVARVLLQKLKEDYVFIT